MIVINLHVPEVLPDLNVSTGNAALEVTYQYNGALKAIGVLQEKNS